jgi:hypothetical protein
MIMIRMIIIMIIVITMITMLNDNCARVVDPDSPAPRVAFRSQQQCARLSIEQLRVAVAFFG